ncbi:MAG TPA: GAF domain-containing sensor histidine kinase, partial [Pyrinomonadaceae bacterium]|nr:GAF domain-containing sensor histidine kinase [Pyrinomonadaceae bacterium]
DGKVIWDEFPGLIGSPFEPLYRQAMDGVAGRITDFYPDHNIWYEINLFPSPTGITVYFRNVTERIKREQNLGFLADLLKDFTPLSTADAIIKLAGARIAEYLKLSHCSFAEISEAANESVIIYDHHDTNSPDLAGSYPLDQFLDAETEIRQLSDGSVVSIDNVDEGRSQESTERFSALGIKSLVCAPYVTDGRWLFALAAFRAEPHKWGTDEIDLLRELAARVCLSIQRARAEEDLERARGELEVRVQERTAELAAANTELQAQAEERLRAQEERVHLLRQVISSQEDERHRIARDMHDDLGQRVTALRLHLETLGEIGGGDASSRKLLEIREIAKELDSDLSSIVWRLRPAALDNVGLKSALADYAAKWSASFGTAIEFRSSEFDDSALSVEVQTCLYRITQEALNNIHKYAEADSVNVILDRREQDITLIVEDDGKGFEPSKNKNGRKGFGLIGMAERAGLCGGVVEIESSPGSGTTIFVRIPISH